MFIVKGKTGDWEIVVGLEVHAQIISNSKLFSGASTKFGSEPNTQVSLIDAAFPGMLPTLNEYCVEQAVKTGLGINANINLFSQFDRKNYFYADLPQGYQISQMYHPIVEKGFMDIINEDKENRRIGITRLHLEQDAGKSMHDQSPTSSFIDLNRSGIALMEIVSEPDIRSPFEAGEYIKKLRVLLRYLGTCDGDMEKGNMRCDANVSVRKKGDEFGTRCEIKNLNSVKNIIKAIEYEAERQVDIIESGGTIDQETRLFDANTLETRTMRSKENAHDYRYFPEPDLLPIILKPEYVERVKKSLPELPEDKIKRYQDELGLTHYDASVLCQDKETSEFFEEVAKGNDAKMASNWITAELFGRLNKAGLELAESKINVANFRDLLELISTEVISGKIAKNVFNIMFETGDNPKKIVKDQGLEQVTDISAIEKIIEKIIENNQDKVAEYKSGKDKLFGFFVGQAMKETEGKASPAIVNEILKRKL